jgi:purine-binding chemotaxis protein CheW
MRLEPRRLILGEGTLHMTQLAQPNPSTASPGAANDLLRQFLAFKLANELFAIEILRVQEIRGITPITPIPNAPAYIRGVMNLRGTIVPVIDLRMRFGLGEAEYNRFTVIIVVRLGARIIGLVVDAVSDVLDVATTDIEAAPDLGARVDTSFLSGMVHRGDEIILLLDLEQLAGLQSDTASLEQSRRVSG